MTKEGASFDPGPAALALLGARRDRRPAGPLDPAIAPRTIVDAALVQRRLATLLDVDRPGGFKLGATGARMQAVLGLDGPAGAFMAARDLHASGVSLPFAAYRGLALECEIAVRLATDLAPKPCSVSQAQAAVGHVMAAMEVVENRYGPPPIGDLAAIGTPTLVADQVYHTAAVLGPEQEWDGRDLRELLGQIEIDGTIRDQGFGAELLGDPLRGLAWLAGSEVAAAFGGLRAGHVVLLGSVTPPVFPSGPCAVLVAFSSLEPVSLRLT